MKKGSAKSDKIPAKEGRLRRGTNVNASRNDVIQAANRRLRTTWRDCTKTGTWLLLAISLAQALNCACAAVHLPHRVGDERHEERRKAEP